MGGNESTSIEAARPTKIWRRGRELAGGTSDAEAVARSPLFLAPAGPRTVRPTCVPIAVCRGLEQRCGLFELSFDDIAFRHPHAEANSVTSDQRVAPQAVRDVHKRARAKLLCHWPVGSTSTPHVFIK